MAAPSESERMAAFDIQVELVTRIGVQELAPGTGSLREALTSPPCPPTRPAARRMSPRSTMTVWLEADGMRAELAALREPLLDGTAGSAVTLTR